MIALYVRAGSRHETAGLNGVSHFLEHLFFRGSVGYPDTVAMNAAVEAAGGSLNGITARDHGCYYTPIHPHQVGTGLAVLGDLIRRPLLKEVDVEREVILEEILDEVDASGTGHRPRQPLQADRLRGPPPRLQDRRHGENVRRLAAAGHAGAPPRRFYNGANLVLAVAGPVDHREVADLAERYLGALPRGHASA